MAEKKKEEKGGNEKMPAAPGVEEKVLVIKSERKKSVKEIMEKISALGFTHLEAKKDELIARKVESEGLKGKPHRYYNLLFLPKKLELQYSITPEMNRKKRQLDMAALMLRVLVLTEAYRADGAEFQQFVLTGIEGAKEFADENYEKTKNLADQLQEKNESLNKKYQELLEVNEKNNKIIMEVEKRNEALAKRVGELEKISDETLAEELYAWLKTHQGEINVLEFAKIFTLSPARVEEGLDKLMKEGYLARTK